MFEVISPFHRIKHEVMHCKPKFQALYKVCMKLWGFGFQVLAIGLKSIQKQVWHLSSGHSGCLEHCHNRRHLVANVETSGTFEM